MARVLALSFEGAVVENDLHLALLRHFVGPDLLPLAASLETGELSPEEFNTRALALVDEDEESLRRFVRREARPRRGLVDLVGWAEENGWLPVVLSDGVDLVVDEVLRGLGLDRLIRHAGRARKPYRWLVRYLSPRGIALGSGFELSYVRAFRGTGDFVAFAAARKVDRRAATAANVVFATGALLADLRRGDRVFPFLTAEDIRDTLAERGAEWEESGETGP